MFSGHGCYGSDHRRRNLQRKNAIQVTQLGDPQSWNAYSAMSSVWKLEAIVVTVRTMMNSNASECSRDKRGR